MPGLRLEGVFWKEYDGLVGKLAANGYLPRKETNRFALYELRKPEHGHNYGASDGTFLAVRKSRLEPDEVENAIFWQAPSLEDAVKALNDIPFKSIGEATKDGMLERSSLLATFGIGVGFGILTHSLGVTVGAVCLYNAVRAVWCLARNYTREQAAMARFGNPLTGKAAIAEAFEFIEIR